MNEFRFTNAWLLRVTPDGVEPFFADARIADGKIAEIARGGSMSARGETVNAGGRVVTSPLVNFHEHCYSRLAKGLPSLGQSGKFTEILENLWWRLDRALDADMIRASAELTAMESIRCGVGYVFDHHSSPSCVAGSLAMIADVFRTYKLRGVLCYETSDRDGSNARNAAISENADFSARHADGDIRAMLGMHALFTMSDATLASLALRQKQTSLGIHTHLAEDAHENEFSQAHFGKSAAMRLYDSGLLNALSIVAHGVYLSDADRKLVAETGCGMACCPDSNMNNRVGLADYTRIPSETPILAGTDGMHANIARTLKQLFLLYRHQGGDMRDAFVRFGKVCANQTDFARRYFEDYSALQTGDRADFVIWDYIPPTPITHENALGHFVYGLLESPARTLISGGKFLMRDSFFTIADESARRAAIAEQGARLHKRFSETSRP